jgi:GNAT superfamily N-acetyltransferase
LHAGPLSCQNIDDWPTDSQISWEDYRNRNLPLLQKLTQIYGACAIIARINDDAIGQLRFYPKAVIDILDAGGLCLQQDFPAGPTDDFVNSDFPLLEKITDKTLVIHCFMMAGSLGSENPFQRKGIGSRMVKFLIQWAMDNGWEHLEVDAFEDLPIIYEITGSAGYKFWEKLGFHTVLRHPHPHLQGHDKFVSKLVEQAKSLGISEEKAKDRLVMRLELK